MTVIRRLVLLSACALSVVAAPAFAQDATPQAAPAADKLTVDPAALDRDSITLGIGAAVLPSYEGSNDYVIVPAAAARGKIKGLSFFTRGTQLLVDVIPDGSGPRFTVEAGPAIGINLNRTGRLVDNRVRALGKIKAAAEGGGFVGIGRTGVITSDYDSLNLRVSYVHDIGDVHRSYLITPSLDYGTPLSKKAYVGLSVSADYAGGGYAQTYFGVDAPGSVRSGLPVFTARKGWKDVTGGILANYALTGDLLHGLSLFATGSYSRLQNDFAASPVTRVAGSRSQWFGAIGLGYTF